jgi:hypothetical protein
MAHPVGIRFLEDLAVEAVISEPVSAVNFP